MRPNIGAQPCSYLTAGRSSTKQPPAAEPAKTSPPQERARRRDSGEPEAGAAGVVRPTARAGLEDPVAELGIEPWAVVAHREPHAPVLGRQLERHQLARMAARVVDQRRQRPPDHVRLTLCVRQPRRLPHAHVLELARQLAEVDRARRGIELLPGDRHQRADRRVDPLGVGDDRTQRLLALGVALRSGRGQRELGTPAHARDRRAQLVRDLAGEALLVPARRRDAGEQPVERRRQPGELVAGRSEPEPAVEIVRAPVLRARRHLGHAAQRGVHRAADRQPARQQHQARHHERADQDLGLQPLQRGHRERHDHRPRRRVAPLRVDRPRAQAHGLRAVALRHHAATPEGDGRPVQRRRDADGALDHARPVEHPRPAVEHVVVGGVADGDAVRAHDQGGELRVGARLQQRRRLAAHAAIQQHVSGHEQRPQPDGQRRERGQQQPPPEAHCRR